MLTEDKSLLCQRQMNFSQGTAGSMSFIFPLVLLVSLVTQGQCGDLPRWKLCSQFISQLSNLELKKPQSLKVLLRNLPNFYPLIKSLSLSFKAVRYLKKKKKRSRKEQNLIKTYRDIINPWRIVSQHFLVSFLNIVAKIIYLEYIFIM